MTPRGRPREAAVDDAIRDATVAVFSESGYEGLRVEVVAERAGVAKSTVYRRFPSKPDLVRHALANFEYRELPCPSGESLPEDLFTFVRRLRDKFASDDLGHLVPALVEAAARHPDLRAVHQRFVAERRRSGIARLVRAVQDGQLRDDTDIDLTMDQLSGPVFYRSYVSGSDLSDATLRRLVAAVLSGCSAKDAPSTRG